MEEDLLELSLLELNLLAAVTHLHGRTRQSAISASNNNNNNSASGSGSSGGGGNNASTTGGGGGSSSSKPTTFFEVSQVLLVCDMLLEMFRSKVITTHSCGRIRVD